ncbi:TolC family protein [Mucilaginibacter xinganensis]|uniref:Outer membrane protein, cobalt-zinc-cadmium efflux system n=1 Tax=Mucilaginibacter xinganensis TaxID=1234841 RepID=A0A223P3G6_9SPHI|nr:TolC family protein [Mucilaginibacter xinganensis]ASU36590.1 outer membrane protein, cobalt-zinc-cadmium efflux system [Mucilaginibacter xinganensis]
MFKRFVLIIILLQAGFFIATKAQAQSAASDTLKLSIKQAEDLFLKNNLQLIIQRYNIDNANAQVITARLFPNPDFNFSNGIHSNDVTDGPAYKDHSMGISQLFTTAGKRNKNIQLAKISVEQSKYQFFDLLRTLKFTLRNDFYTIYFQQQSASVYNQEITSLSKALTVFKAQYAKGNIAQKEVLRIQSQLYTLQAEYNNLQTGIDTVQSELKLLIKTPVATVIQPQADNEFEGKAIVASVPYQTMLDSAYVNRYDLKLAKSAVDYNNVNLQLQKATAVPDFSLSLNYDRLGSYGTNFLGAGIGFSLPFFNRNQGGIKQARIAIDQSKVQLQSQQDHVESDVASNYKSALRLENLYNSFDPAFKSDFNHLIQEVFKNYEKRNISLLEFLDFYDSYKTNTLQLNTLQLNRVTSLEQLNYVTGTPFFNK